MIRFPRLLPTLASIFFLALFQVRNASSDNVTYPYINFYSTYSLDTFANITGGHDTGVSVFGLLDADVTVNLHDNFKIHASAFWLEGENPSANTGDFNTLSNIAGVNTVRLYHAWLETTFPTESIKMKLGKIAVDDDFMLSNHSSLFINSAFGILPTVSGNMPVPNFPLSGLGVHLDKTMGNSGYFQLGIYDGDVGTESGNRHGLNNAIDSDEGLAVFFETGLTLQLDSKPGTYSLGWFYHSGEFTEFSNEKTVDDNYGLYVMFDQLLIKESGHPGLALFSLVSFSPMQDRNSVHYYADIGLNVLGPFTNRPNDRAGIGLSYTRFSKDFMKNQRLAGFSHTNQEIVLEITYETRPAKWLRLIPDIQFIFDPAFSRDDAIVIGGRLEISL